MVTRRKRAAPAIEDEPTLAPPPSTKKQNKNTIPSTAPILKQVRGCWEFAALGQYLFIFGTALKIPDTWNIDILENEFLGNCPQQYLPQIKLALLRQVSSQKGLAEEQFEEYTRRQYLAKKPSANPFGEDEQPIKFIDLDVLTRIRVLYQLSQWTLIHPDRLREKLDDVTEKAQQEWRIEPCGLDAHSNSYFLLDDNRLYRRTAMEVPTTTKLAKAPAKKKTVRPTKRRRLTNGTTNGMEEEHEDIDAERVMLESMEWSCVCATISEYLEFINKLKKSKNTDEKELCAYLVEDVMPVLEAAEEEKKKEEVERQRKLALEAAVANRKRSSRIDARIARQREEEERAEAERKRQAELEAEREAAARLERIGRERESRLAAREKRLRGKEMSLALRRELLNKESADDSDSTAAARISARRREIEAKKLAEEQERLSKEWLFDCICGIHGTNLDDGTPQVACDRCNVWQHVACLDLSPGTENKEFICDRCLNREKAESLAATQPVTASPRITIKLKLPQAHYQEAPIRVKEPTELYTQSNIQITTNTATTLPPSPPRSNTNYQDSHNNTVPPHTPHPPTDAPTDAQPTLKTHAITARNDEAVKHEPLPHANGNQHFSVATTQGLATSPPSSSHTTHQDFKSNGVEAPAAECHKTETANESGVPGQLPPQPPPPMVTKAVPGRELPQDIPLGQKQTALPIADQPAYPPQATLAPSLSLPSALPAPSGPTPQLASTNNTIVAATPILTATTITSAGTSSSS